METPNGTFALIPLDQLIPHPRNPKRGDVDAIAESIQVNGFRGAITVQRSTNYIVKGNHTFAAAQQLGMAEIPAIVEDMDDETAVRYLIADNRTAELGTYDETGLVALLEEFAHADTGLEGTGFDADDLDDLVASLEGNMGNMAEGLTPAERLADYRESGVRSIVLPFPIDRHEDLVKKLATLRAEYQLDNNSDLFAALVDTACEK